MAHFIGEEAEISDNMDALPDVALQHVFSFIGKGHYRYVAGTSQHFCDVYSIEHEQKTEWKQVAASIPRAKLCLEDVREAHSGQVDRSVALDSIVKGASSIGNVGTLEWACNEGFEFTRAHFTAAGRHDHLNVLEWAEEKGLPWYSRNVMNAAARCGNIDILEWIHTTGGEIPFRIAEEAAKFGRVPVLVWMEEHDLLSAESKGIEWVSFYAARFGHTNVLDWLFDNGYNLIEGTIILNGVRFGHLKVLIWARDRGFEFRDFEFDSPDACAYAALGGHLTMLQWLRENDCPWDATTILWAQDEGHDHIVEWAIANGCPTPEE